MSKSTHLELMKALYEFFKPTIDINGEITRWQIKKYGMDLQDGDETDIPSIADACLVLLY